MNISEKNARVWRKDIEGRNGTFYRYSVGISKKLEDGSYLTAYMPIRFTKRANMPEKIDNGAKCDFSGFLSVDTYLDKEGHEVRQIIIVAMNATLTDEGDPSEGVDSFEQAEDEIPF